MVTRDEVEIGLRCFLERLLEKRKKGYQMSTIKDIFGFEDYSLKRK
ncbi:MAG: hypothetical protein ABIA78_03110 [archaeon]